MRIDAVRGNVGRDPNRETKMQGLYRDDTDMLMIPLDHELVAERGERLKM